MPPPGAKAMRMVSSLRTSMGTVAIALTVCVLSSIACRGDVPFDPVLNSEQLWSNPASPIVDLAPEGCFDWVSAARDSARYPAYADCPQLTFLGRRIFEANLRVRENRPVAFEISLYNRGDSGTMKKEEFAALTASIATNLDAWAGAASVTQSTVRMRTGVREERRGWIRGGITRAELRWSAAGKGRDYRPEYILLVLQPVATNPPPAAAGPAARASAPAVAGKKDIRQNVRSESGGVRIDGIPMVDQGDRGYCVIATTERVLRYYGRDANLHQLAQLADSSAGGGTGLHAMRDMLEKMGQKWGIRSKVEYRMGMTEFTKFLDDYNRLARKAKKPQVLVNWEKDNSSFKEIMSRMDTATALQARAEDKAGLKNFQKLIAKNVDAGIPLLWGVTLGWVRETAELQQETGSHMRLIVGYNLPHGEILFSDSWGAGHECKPMRLADAWAITSDIIVIEPRG